MIKAFFHTPRYSFWDLIPLAIISAAARHDEYVIAGVTIVIAIAINVAFDVYYKDKS
jgi:hypothetical protein